MLAVRCASSSRRLQAADPASRWAASAACLRRASVPQDCARLPSGAVRIRSACRLAAADAARFASPVRERGHAGPRPALHFAVRRHNSRARLSPARVLQATIGHTDREQDRGRGGEPPAGERAGHCRRPEVPAASAPELRNGLRPLRLLHLQVQASIAREKVRPVPGPCAHCAAGGMRSSSTRSVASSAAVPVTAR